MSINRTDGPGRAPGPREFQTDRKQDGEKKTGERPSGGDRADFSHRARETRRLEALAGENRVFRRERVESTKQQIDEGTYRVDHRQLASRLLKGEID